MTPEQKRKQLLLLQEQERSRGGVSTNSEAVGDFKGKIRAMTDGAQQGATYGFLDEGVGGLSAALGMTPEGGVFDYSGNFGDRYEAARDKVRGQQAQSAESEPLMYRTGDIGGMTAQALASAPIAMGKGLGGTMLRGAGIGAAEGAAHNIGRSEGVPDPKSVALDATIGAGAGLLAPVAVAGGAALKNAATDPATGIVDALLKRANTTKANRAVANTVKASGQSQGDIARAVARAASEGQPEFRVADALGLSGQRGLSGLARSGGDTGQEIAEFLSRRQAGQPERVGSFVDDAFGMKGSTASQVRADLTEARGTAADAAYGAARGNAAPVDVRGAVEAIDARLGPMSGAGVAGDSIDAKLAKYRSRLAASDPANTPVGGPGATSVELSDFDRVLGVKQDLQDDMAAAYRAGRNNEYRELKKLEDQLDLALEASSEMYRSANDGFREASRVIDSVDAGAAMSRPSMRAGDTVTQFQGLTPEQQAAARVGYGDRLLSQIEANSSPTANRAKPLQSPKRVSEADAMALDPELYANRLSRENTMWETQNRALGGSRTADNLEDIAATGQSTSGLGGVARSLANLQVGDAAAQVGGMLGPITKGQTDQTRQLIAQALLSKNPRKALTNAMAQDIKSQKQRRIVEALLRSMGHKQASRY
jgi:hypothetical protein